MDAPGPVRNAPKQVLPRGRERRLVVRNLLCANTSFFPRAPTQPALPSHHPLAPARRYTQPYMPGGTKFMRNPPLPLAVCYPDGLPAGVEDIATKDVNGIQVPLSAQPHGMQTVLIDAMKRSAE